MFPELGLPPIGLPGGPAVGGGPHPPGSMAGDLIGADVGLIVRDLSAENLVSA